MAGKSPLVACWIGLAGVLIAVCGSGCRTHQAGPATAPTAAISADPPHLAWAKRMVAEIQPENNQQGYRPTIVQWAGTDGATVTRNRSVCSSFITGLLKQAYGYTPQQLEAWLGTAEPRVASYYDAIAAGKNFTTIERVQDIRPGDLLAVRYTTQGNGTGDMMLVAASPSPRRASPPLVENTRQYDLLVIDCNKSGHGEGDTRRKPNGTWHAGVGMGTIRLYADAQGKITGYANSAQEDSHFRDSSQRQIAIGRLIPDKPAISRADARQ